MSWKDCPDTFKIVRQAASPRAYGLLYGSSSVPIYSAWTGNPNCADVLFTTVCPDEPEPSPDIPPTPTPPDYPTPPPNPTPVGPTPPNPPDPDNPDPDPDNPDNPENNPSSDSFAGQLRWTWTWGGDDNTINALLNGSNVCTHHSKSHVIYYSISGTGGTVAGGGNIVTAGCTGGWAANPYEDRSPPGSVSITCEGTFFGVTHSKSGTNSLSVTITINLATRTWTMT